MSRYNLIEEKWIPVRFPDGSREELGIRDTLLRAKEIKCIEDGSPLVVAALHRFLLAVLYRALEGPRDILQAKAFFKSGFPATKIEAYLEKWRNRLWLFDDRFPFGQIPGFEPKIWRAWTALAAEHNADNAKVLFDHIDVENPESITAAAAARWMLATQTFSVSCGKSELSHTGTAPSATAAMVIPVGRSLEDGLLFSLIPQNREILESDIPIWERVPDSVEVLKAGAERIPIGLADRYTWRTRSIRLAESESGRIEKIAFASGIKCGINEQVDPMLAYRIDDKLGKLPRQFPERGIWRNFDSLLPDESKLAPSVIEHAAALAKSDMKRFPNSIEVLGQSNDKAKIEFWRMEYFTLPGSIAGDRFIRSDIHGLLDKAEDVQKALWISCRNFAKGLLSRGDRDPAGKDIGNFVDQMPCTPTYWTILEVNFHEVLKAFTIDVDAKVIELKWLLALRSALLISWNQHKNAVSMGDAWAIRALVKSESAVLKKSAELEKMINEFRPGLKQEVV